jgi:hypothetical protein
MVDLPSPANAGCAVVTVCPCMIPIQHTGKLTFCLMIVNNDDFISRYRLLVNGREKTLNELGTSSSRLSI